MMKRNTIAIVISSTLSVLTTQNLYAGETLNNVKQENTDMEKISVVGTKQSRYIIEVNDGATGLDLSFLDNPRNTILIPEQLILDRKVTTLEEALRNAPGVSAGDGFGGTRDDFFMRGFRRNAEYRNGFRRTSIFKANMSNTEYVQLVQGPAAITYGQVEPGGVVDVITKKPLNEQRIAGELRTGSYNDKFGMIDYSQPINEDFSIRLVASIQDSESFRDFTDIKRDTFAFSSRYYLADSTKIDFAYEYRNEARPLDRGTIAIETTNGPAIINDLLDVPFSQRFGSPWEIGEVEAEIFELSIGHDFNDLWNLELNIAHEGSTGNDLQSRPRAAFVVDADTAINEQGYITSEDFDPSVITDGAIYDDSSDRVYLIKRLDGSRDKEVTADLANIKLRGEFELGSMLHQVILGADYSNDNTDRKFTVGSQTDGINSAFHSFIDPVYNLSGDFSLDGLPILSAGSKNYGAYFNIYSHVTEKLGVLAGMRYSDTDYEATSDGVITSQTASSGVVPQLGLNYKVLDNTSVYASFSESFEPNNVIPNNTGDAEEIDPEEGEQIEFGVKSEFFSGKAQTTLSFYKIDKINVVDGLDDLGDPIFVDGRSSQGVEFSVTGQPTDGMNISVSYAYTDAEDQDALGNKTQAESIADNIFNMYTSYEFQSGYLEGLGLGAGYYYESDRVMDAEGNLSQQVNLGDISLVDLSAWYTIKAPDSLSKDGTIRFQAGVKNLFDDEYYGAGFTVLRIPLGSPRTAFASVSFDF